jgi:hypothetical protein
MTPQSRERSYHVQGINYLSLDRNIQQTVVMFNETKTSVVLQQFVCGGVVVVLGLKLTTKVQLQS